MDMTASRRPRAVARGAMVRVSVARMSGARLSVALVAGCLLAAGGCFSGTYDDAHTKSLSRYRDAGDLQRLHPEPKSLADGRLRLRVPKIFTKEQTEQPPILDDLPGFRVTVQEFFDAGDGAKMPATLSIWAALDEAAGLDDTKKLILTKIQAQKDTAFANPSWSTVDEPRGGPSSWAVMTLQGQQPFDRLAAGEQSAKETKSTEGTTRIWVAADPASKVCTVLMWRVPRELAGQVDDLVPLVARTVDMNTAGPPAAPADAAPAAPAADAAPKQP